MNNFQKIASSPNCIEKNHLLIWFRKNYNAIANTENYENVCLNIADYYPELLNKDPYYDIAKLVVENKRLKKLEQNKTIVTDLCTEILTNDITLTNDLLTKYKFQLDAIRKGCLTFRSELAARPSEKPVNNRDSVEFKFKFFCNEMSEIYNQNWVKSIMLEHITNSMIMMKKKIQSSLTSKENHEFIENLKAIREDFLNEFKRGGNSFSSDSSSNKKTSPDNSNFKVPISSPKKVRKVVSSNAESNKCPPNQQKKRLPQDSLEFLDNKKDDIIKLNESLKLSKTNDYLSSYDRENFNTIDRERSNISSVKSNSNIKTTSSLEHETEDNALDIDPEEFKKHVHQLAQSTSIPKSIPEMTVGELSKNDFDKLARNLVQSTSVISKIMDTETIGDVSKEDFEKIAKSLVQSTSISSKIMDTGTVGEVSKEDFDKRAKSLVQSTSISSKMMDSETIDELSKEDIEKLSKNLSKSSIKNTRNKIPVNSIDDMTVNPEEFQKLAKNIAQSTLKPNSFLNKNSSHLDKTEHDLESLDNADKENIQQSNGSSKSIYNKNYSKASVDSLNNNNNKSSDKH